LIVFLTLAITLLLFSHFFQPPKPIPPLITPMPSLPKATPSKTPPSVFEQGDQPSEITKSLEKNFPLFSFLPYETEKYRLTYQAPFELKIKLKSNQEDQQIIQQEIASWMKSKGIDPASHQLIFVTPAL